MSKQIAQVTINRGTGKKEHVQMFVLGETTTGFYLTNKLDPNDFGLPKSEWLPKDSLNIQCQLVNDNP